MKLYTRREFVFASVLAVLGAAGVFLIVAGVPASRESGGGAGSVDTGWPTGPVRIEGDVVKAVSPGVKVPLDLKVTNTQDFDVSVTALTVAVRRVEAPNADDARSCSVDDFGVDQAHHELRISLAARATNTLSGLRIPPEMWPRIGMLDRPVNQDGCKGASLTLDYTASGTGERP